MTGLTKQWMIAIILMASLFCGLSSASIAAEEEALVLSIDVEGMRYVERGAVLAQLHSKVGQRLDRRQLSRDVQRLYKAGFFSDIRFVGTRTKQGIHLVCHVKEFPLIANLTIEGNEEHRTKDLQLRMKLRPGRIFNPMNSAKDRSTLLKGYLKDGFYQVNVDFIPTTLPDGRVDLLVRIHEGEITRINRIHIIGNKAFSDSTLRNQLASKQPDLATWVTNSDVFDQKRFGSDTQMLQQYYMNNGYLDIKIESRQITISEDKKSFSLTFSLHEGKPYRVSSINIQGDLVPDKQTLEELIKFDVDDTYDMSELQASIAAMNERIGDEGYAFATVTPLLNRNTDNHTVAIVFDIEKGNEVYIERINITGNEKSEDTVVRRLITQDEGARYSGSQIKVSREALGRATFVEDVRISLPKGSANDKVDMNIDITERRTGSISGGIGYSQREKVILTAKISESNLFGKGYQANINGQYGQITQDLNVSLTDPFFFGPHVSASVSAFKKKTDPLATVAFQTNSSGAGLGFGIPLSHDLRYNINYRFNQTTLSNIAANASLLTRSQVGTQTIGELIQSLNWDSRDRFIATTSGHVESISFGFSGLGGQSKFWEAAVSSQAYFPFGENHDYVLNPSFSAAIIHAYGQSDIPLFRRYSLGGIGSMRGLDASGISLRDPATGEALGADKQARASLNFFFPPPFLSSTAGIRGLIFADVGTVWGSLSTTVGALSLNINEPFALSRLRYTAGFAIEWISPVGPVGLVWSFPIKLVAGDVERGFEFVLGASF
ncbi:MAG: outer membrane protein assembly factor BamA [Mariprofundus sp.]|nr:outer membrane protein assembly factor BamA [Mariprofundus sp.]